MPEPLPSGHDLDDPPWADIRSGPPEPVPLPPGSSDLAVAAHRIFQNVAMPEPPPPLEVTAFETLLEGASAEDRQAAEDRLLEVLGSVMLYYETFPPSDKDARGVFWLGEDETSPSVEQEVMPSFTGILDLEEGSTSLTVFELALQAPPPKEDDQILAVATATEQVIYGGQLHGYKAKCTTSASASVRASRGGVRLRLYRNGHDLGAVTDYVGGGASPSIGSTTPTKVTLDIAVRGLGLSSQRNEYHTNIGWVRGSGGECP
jgi:hypothetical protein